MAEEPLRILVALDGSPGSERGLEAALAFVRGRGADLSLLRVSAGPADSDAARRYLEDVCGRLGRDPGGVEMHVRHGAPAEQILKFVQDVGVDLVAMSTHARRGWGGGLAGSVTREVLRRTEVPVLVVRPEVSPRADGRLVVALDGSPASELALADAARLARRLNEQVDLVRISAPLVTASGVGEPPLMVSADDHAPYLAAKVQGMSERGVRARPVSKPGGAAAEVVRHARECEARLICMTTHGRSGVARLLLGSVAEEIVRTSPCPVLVRRIAAPSSGGLP